MIGRDKDKLREGISGRLRGNWLYYFLSSRKVLFGLVSIAGIVITVDAMLNLLDVSSPLRDETPPIIEVTQNLAMDLESNRDCKYTMIVPNIAVHEPDSRDKTGLRSIEILVGGEKVGEWVFEKSFEVKVVQGLQFARPATAGHGPITVKASDAAGNIRVIEVPGYAAPFCHYSNPPRHCNCSDFPSQNLGMLDSESQ